MASFDSSLTEADCVVQGACDATGTMGHDYSALGGFIGMGPDGAQHPFSRPERERDRPPPDHIRFDQHQRRIVHELLDATVSGSRTILRWYS